MDSMAKRCKLLSVESFLKSENNQADFKILSEDGKEFKVHSILLHGRGQFFETAITADFKERKEQELKLPVKSEVVKAFVDFLDGKDLAENLKLDTLKSLLLDIGEVYDFKDLQMATKPQMLRKFLQMTKTDIYEELKIFAHKECVVGVDLCQYVLEKMSWLKVVMATGSATSWTALTDKPVEGILLLWKDGTWANINLLGFRIHVKPQSDVKLVIEHKKEVVETTQFQGKLDMFVDAIDVIFKKPCEIRGTPLSIKASGHGAIWIFQPSGGMKQVYKNEKAVDGYTIDMNIYQQRAGFIKELYF